MGDKAFFLDRDGTLMENRGYTCHHREVKYLPGTFDVLRRIQGAGYRLVVVTNQSAVARGICTEEEVRVLHQRMHLRMKEEGVHFSGFFFCPYHPEATVNQYRRVSEDRKPGTGMLLRAAAELGIDRSRSYMVGDNVTDIIAGKAAGCRTVLVTTGHGLKSLETIRQQRIHVDHVCTDLPSMVAALID